VYESINQAVITRNDFLRRLLLHTSCALLVLLFSLGIGIAGYMFFEQLSWVDAFLNATMLLGGMGPVNAPQSTVGKLFAGFYALYAGLVFVVTTGMIFTPVLHRVLHKLHLDEE
jgi:hypothetical protein